MNRVLTNIDRVSPRGVACCVLLMLLPQPVDAVDPRSTARQTTFLEYSRNIAAYYPRALAQRLQDIQAAASGAHSAARMCRHAIEQVPQQLEDNPNRRIKLIGAAPFGTAADAWERAALDHLAGAGSYEHHELVQSPAGEMFRYVALLDGLPDPCGALLRDDALRTAVSILRRAGPAAGDSRKLPPANDRVRSLPARQGPRR